MNEVLDLHVPQKSRLVFIHMLVWLLQHDLLIQVHPFVYLYRPLDPSALESKERLSPQTAGDALERSEFLFRSVTHHLLADKGVRLMELLWREHISQHDFDLVLKAYSDHIKVCWHP